MPPYKALILDLNGVLITVSPDKVRAITLSQIKQAFESPTWQNYERGTIEREECDPALASELGVSEEAWTTGIKQLVETITPIPEMINAVADWKKRLPGLKVYGFSNMPKSDYFLFEPYIKEWGVHDEFYPSGCLGSRKPEGDSYLAILDKHGLRPEECIFVDDTPGHVVGARAVGLTSVLCKDIGETIKEVRELLGLSE